MVSANAVSSAALHAVRVCTWQAQPRDFGIRPVSSGLRRLISYGEKIFCLSATLLAPLGDRRLDPHRFTPAVVKAAVGRRRSCLLKMTRIAGTSVLVGDWNSRTLRQANRPAMWGWFRRRNPAAIADVSDISASKGTPCRAICWWKRPR